ncbi:MAG: hypothetical protein ACSLFQ_10605 [Thermoanaerobaculia bacterium]
MTTALSQLLRGLIDYAGLFPPAGLPMETAVTNYALYRASAERWMLGRLIVPVARLRELESAAGSIVSDEGDAWAISALPRSELRAELETIEVFNEHHRGRLVVDALEMKVATSAGIAAASALIPPGIETYFELPLADDPDSLVEAIATAGRRAKIRTGGVTEDAFPPAAQIARFIARCNERGVAFKATAGLHHPLRCVRPLTYEPESPVGTMNGFLNVFLAAALVHNGYPVALAEELLAESDPSSLRFEADSIAWRDHTLTTAEIASSREKLAHSFGSCSFAEPVSELAELARIEN